MRLFLFRLDAEWFALRSEHVRGVLPRDGANPGAARLSVPGARSSDSAANLIVVACPGGAEALLEVDGVTGLVEVREDAVQGVPAFVFPEAAVTVSGVFAWDGALAALLDPAGLDLRPAPPLAS